MNTDRKFVKALEREMDRRLDEYLKGQMDQDQVTVDWEDHTCDCECDICINYYGDE